jgi:hypothetical protein
MRQTAFKFEYGIANNLRHRQSNLPCLHLESRQIHSVVGFPYPPIGQAGLPEEIRSYLEAESLFSMAIASRTVVINCAGKMIVEFFSVAISAIVCSVRS